MWLLDVRSKTLRLFFGNDTPRYTILSHTWADDEVTFQDVQNGMHEGKKGWYKIKSALERTRQDKYEYLWVDTCCIDKTSSAELSEAINSMFRWYSEADICYIYLADVTSSADETLFAHSRWFTRGWTLQELLAPLSALFFDDEWRYIASRTDLAQSLARITGIGEAVLLDNRALSTYSVAQRMSWAARRQTTRLEDRAYSLLGIFDVNMPLLYGEGKKAFHRLQEEIVRNSTDLSILAWSNPMTLPSRVPLASDLEDFDGSGYIVASQWRASSDSLMSETTLTNVAVRITARVLFTTEKETSSSGLAMILNCRPSSDITTVIALKLSPVMDIRVKKLLEEMTTLDTLDCVVGWDAGYKPSRLMHVDALEAANQSKLLSVVIARNYITTTKLPRLKWQRDWSHVWLRFEDASIEHEWVTMSFHPEEYWNRERRTFDLAAARADKERQDEATAAARTDSFFGLPIFGAMELKHKDDNIFIFFCQRNSSLEDGMLYEVVQGNCNVQEERPVESRIRRPFSARLSSGSDFEVRLYEESIDDHVIAHLQISLLDRRDSRQTPLLDENDVRNVMQSIRRRRDRKPKH